MECSIKNIFGALLFVLFVSSVKSENNAEAEKYEFTPQKYKLEIVTKKEHYDVKLISKAENFTGTVTIEFKSNITLTKGFKIVLDADATTQVTSHELKGSKSSVLSLSKIDGTDAKIVEDKLIITVPEPQPTPKPAAGYDNFQLVLTFSNPFGNDMTGFYRSIYKDGDKDRVLLTTHFEPIFARKAFPCFDEPHLKAQFEICITVPNKMGIGTVLSNTERKAQPKVSGDGETVVHSFEITSVPMSTYLVAFTASGLQGTDPKKFKCDYQENDSEKKMRTYGRKVIIDRNEAALAQEIGVASMVELKEYLGIGYPLGKVDQVGIPDFSAGAMENYGHISFREKSLFFNDTLGTAATKQANVLTITHELVHQWFGNLVTLKNWNYIWLNEAFANYIEYIIASKFTQTKDWNLLNQMVVNEIHLRAFETDGLSSSNPLNNNITDDSLIFSSFNDIPYSKGAAVLRMWNLQLKDDGFQKTLKQYLEENKAKAVGPEELMKVFKETGKLKESNFKSWTDKAGYPVVEVKKINGTYTLSQTRFFWENKTETNTFWEVPITYSADNLQNFTTIPNMWLKKDNIKINHTCKWIIVNNEQAGYYRVNYDKENWNALAKALSASEHSKIPEVNRAQIINDAFGLARSLQKEYVEYSTALDLAKYLQKEKSLIPWKTALHAFEFLQTKLDKEDFGKFKDYILPLIKDHFKSLDSTKLDHVGKLMNVEISRWACSLDYDACVKEAKKIFNETAYKKFPDTQEIILCTAVRNDKNAWEKVSKEYEEEEDSALKIMYISALGCSTNQTQLELFLHNTLTDTCKIRKQDLSFVLSSVYNGNLNNVDIAFKFIESKYKDIAEKYGGINPLGKAVVGIARKLRTASQFERLKKLAEKIIGDPKLSAAKENVKNAVDIADSNVKWVNSKMKHVKKYLNSGSFLSYSIVLLSLSLLTVFQF